VQLANEADAENLYKKLRSSARAVCDDNAGGHRTLEVRSRAEKCVNQVLADAVRKINQPLLTTLHESKTRSSDVG
jgi:UrcA family protein